PTLLPNLIPNYSLIHNSILVETKKERVGSSGEFSAIGESLTEQCRVEVEGPALLQPVTVIDWGESASLTANMGLKVMDLGVFEAFGIKVKKLGCTKKRLKYLALLAIPAQRTSMPVRPEARGIGPSVR
ncbi:hypothetical protein HAX54_030314, partial [Datura stramonium]|nr:hypothetical protein [Datura stramonium]